MEVAEDPAVPAQQVLRAEPAVEVAPELGQDRRVESERAPGLPVAARQAEAEQGSPTICAEGGEELDPGLEQDPVSQRPIDPREAGEQFGRLLRGEPAEGTVQVAVDLVSTEQGAAAEVAEARLQAVAPRAHRVRQLRVRSVQDGLGPGVDPRREPAPDILEAQGAHAGGHALPEDQREDGQRDRWQPGSQLLLDVGEHAEQLGYSSSHRPDRKIRGGHRHDQATVQAVSQSSPCGTKPAAAPRMRVVLPTGFDPDGPSTGDRAYGLPHSVEQAAVRVVPVPWEGTVSSGRGTAGGPAAVLEATHQVELFHLVHSDRTWRSGVTFEEADPRVVDWDMLARRHRRPQVVDRLSLDIDGLVHERVAAILDGDQIPALLGGEHSVALGGIVAAAERFAGLGVLHIDAHADLRASYEGFARSHASVMFHVLRQAPDLAALVQVGLRDVGRCEARLQESEPAVTWWTDRAIGAALARGGAWSSLVDRLLLPLPERVWVSVDVDGLDPSLAPNTGTPVPGGLTWQQITFLLERLCDTDRRIVGFDLCEVAGERWDAAVGARLLWELAGAATSGLRHST